MKIAHRIGGLLTAIILMMTMAATAQTKAYDVSKDAKTGDLVFNGPVTFAELNNEPTFKWLKEGYEGYKPNERYIPYLKQELKKYSLVVFLGTWCEDSHYLIPKLEKLLTAIDYPMGQVSMYGSDREKTTKNGENKKYNITLVPAIIILDPNGNEKGRITESVNKSLEEDITAFIR